MLMCCSVIRIHEKALTFLPARYMLIWFWKCVYNYIHCRYCNIYSSIYYIYTTSWWFQISFVFIPKIGEDVQFGSTTNQTTFCLQYDQKQHISRAFQGSHVFISTPPTLDSLGPWHFQLGLIFLIRNCLVVSITTWVLLQLLHVQKVDSCLWKATEGRKFTANKRTVLKKRITDQCWNFNTQLLLMVQKSHSQPPWTYIKTLEVVG